jgi:tRNA 2-selenouridine synthase
MAQVHELPEPLGSSAKAVPTVPVGAVLGGSAFVVDLRSPAEFAADHLPAAVNIPLFDDVERAIIGTLYKQRSPDAAFVGARRMARARITGLVREIARATGRELRADDLEGRLERMTTEGIAGLEGALVAEPREALPEPSVVFHCWRGGLRSRSVVAFVRALGLDGAMALAGGYKAYRREVLVRLADAAFPPAVVLRGLTGVGKTLVLREIECLRPRWTVDLEALAGHRSSILGMVGLEPCSQKMFESRLLARLTQGLEHHVVFEGESRKVGDVVVPDAAWASLTAGANIELFASTARRIDVLVEDYLARPANRAELRAQLPFIEERLGAKKWAGKLVRLLDDGRERELVEVLLERYYDPLYRHSEKGRAYALSLDAADPVGAAERVVEWIELRSEPG